MFTIKNITTGEFTDLFFEASLFGLSKLGKMKRITKWVAENLGQFNLNEPHSCKVEFNEDFDKPSITIRGDEDSVRLELVHLVNDNVISL